MIKVSTTVLAAGFISVCQLAFAQTQTAPKPVTVDTFVRAETDRYLAANAKEAGGVGKFHHLREPADIDNQTVIRLNRDTLYSFGVFDLAAGPVTIEMPDAGKRFMSMMVIDQDHYVPKVVYGSKPLTLDQKDLGTRYAVVAIRTLVDANDPKDLAAVHALQDAIKVSQKSPGVLELPEWDQTSLTSIRNALLELAKYNPSFAGAFGARGEVDPIHHLIGTAAGWGGNPDKEASYDSAAPAKNDGKTVYKLTVPKDVPVDSFWSVSVYNAGGYFQKNPQNAYSINDITGKKNADGSVTIQFGGCDGKIPNCLPITDGWNYTVRMYQPRAEILDGKWKFPQPQAVSQN